jgi:hypothetical protein
VRNFKSGGLAREAGPPADDYLELEAVTDHTLIFPGSPSRRERARAWAQAVAPGYDGMVAKDEASPYRGGRTLSWLKVKQRDYRVEERGWDNSTR